MLPPWSEETRRSCLDTPGSPGHSTGNCLVSREGCRHMHRGLRPGGLYLEGLDAKLHYDCNNGGRGATGGL